MVRETATIDTASFAAPTFLADNVVPFVPPKEQIGFALEGFAPRPAANGSLALEFGPDAEVKRRIRTSYKTLPFRELNAIAQARDEYEGIEELAHAIQEAGFVIHDPLVAQFNEEEARSYLGFVNGVYGDKVVERKKLSDLTPATEQGHEVFYIVIAGHRRLRALEMNQAQDVNVKVIRGVDALQALVLQAQENTPRLLKDYERAEQHGRLWAVSKAAETGLTHEQFASRMGVNPRVVLRDLRYYGLPEKIKEFVVPRERKDTGKGSTVIKDQPLMPFTVACQIGRLVEAGVPEHDVFFLALNMFREGVSSEREAGNRVTAYLQARKLDISDNMGNLFGENYNRQARKAQRNRDIVNKFAPPIDDARAFLSRAVLAQEMGLSFVPEDRISYAGVATKLVDFARVAQVFVDNGKEYFKDPVEIEAVQQVLKEMREFAQGILPEDVRETVVFDESSDSV